MTESEAKLVKHTSTWRQPATSSLGKDLEAEILIDEVFGGRGATPDPILVPVPVSTPTVRRVIRKPRRKATTPAEKRMKKIRGLLAKMPDCPAPEKYCHWMDTAKIPLPQSVRGQAKDYRDAYKSKKFAAVIRNEKSRAWSGIQH
jgi:hypothetical protein